jgi:hypothetical protein
MEIFGPEKEVVKRGSRKLHNLFCSPNVMRVIKHRRIAWAGMWHIWDRRECTQGSDGESWEKEHIWNSEM